MGMDPRRKRRIRLVVALSAALLLAGALLYTTFSGASQAATPSQLLGRGAGGASYELTGVVARGTLRRDGDELAFRVRDRNGQASVPVRYAGTVPDPFREGREILVKVRRRGGVFVGESGSLVTKCPSKFTNMRGS
jgi:cytochrome c-type biogenesis protein CcmE